ncbi:hypothetical protein C2G38_2155523 [Gigaspora rosea]|uniref:Uncharacterized protein n=1 Tax=Gigaspora rosea TaxID=44941 RepID=A0A397W775_9GLOM|nr:hypothetical protein C2G38_2155523 [Gigaspora rosea]
MVQFEPELGSNEPEVDQFEPELGSNEHEVDQFEPELSSNEPEVVQFEPSSGLNEPEVVQFEPISGSSDLKWFNLNQVLVQRIELLHQAGIDVPTIRAILKEEFGNHVTWIYNDIYDFIYYLEGSLKKKELDTKEFTKILEQFKYDNDKMHLETLYPPAAAYLSCIEKTKEKLAACFNCDTFMADMTTTQYEESMNNMMKGYLDANTSLNAFISAFQSALEAASILTTYALKKLNNNYYNQLCKNVRIFQVLNQPFESKDMKKKQIEEL